MTPKTSFSISSDGKCICSDSTINPGLDHVWFPVDKTFDYLSELDKGVFMSKYTRLNDELVFDTLWQHIQYPLIHKNLLKDSSQNYLLFEPIKNSWVNEKCCKIYFYILEVEFKYIHSGAVNLELLDIWLTDFIVLSNQTLTTNYITEIVSIKPFTPNSIKPPADTLVYEGLMMTRFNFPYRLENTIGFSSRDDISDYFVPVEEKKYNFEKSFGKGVFITSEFKTRRPELDYLRCLIPYLLQVKTINTKLPRSYFIYDINIKSPINLYKYKRLNVYFRRAGSFIWQEHHNDHQFFTKYRKYYFSYRLYNCKIKYIFVDTLEVEKANPYAKNEEEAFLKYTLPVYFITEIEYMKPPEKFLNSRKQRRIFKKI
jgi:hypothetical protein